METIQKNIGSDQFKRTVTIDAGFLSFKIRPLTIISSSN